MKINIPKQLKKFVKGGLVFGLLFNGVLGITQLSADTINQQYYITPQMPSGMQVSDTLQQDAENVKEIYYINQVIENVSKRILANKGWRNKFFYLDGYTIFDFDKFLDLYSAMCEMENKIISDKLSFYGYNTKLENTSDLKEIQQIQQNIERLLKTSARNFKNLRALLDNFKELLAIKNRCENKAFLANSLITRSIFMGHYKSNNPKIGNISQFSLLKIDEIFFQKLNDYIVYLVDNVAKNPGFYLRFFKSKSIEHVKPIENNTYQEVIEPGY